MFSQAMISIGVVLLLACRNFNPSAINGAMNFKILGPIAVVTISAWAIPSATALGSLPLLIPLTS